MWLRLRLSVYIHTTRDIIGSFECLQYVPEGAIVDNPKTTGSVRYDLILINGGYAVQFATGGDRNTGLVIVSSVKRGLEH
jgi:hypothetical protein